jgi:hypothetical protein
MNRQRAWALMLACVAVSVYLTWWLSVVSIMALVPICGNDRFAVEHRPEIVQRCQFLRVGILSLLFPILITGAVAGYAALGFKHSTRPSRLWRITQLALIIFFLSALISTAAFNAGFTSAPWVAPSSVDNI